MKIAGKTPGVNRGTITFHRPDGVFRLTLQALGYGFPERIERDVPSPQPPLDYARDAKSGAALRDENGLAVKVENTRDGRYQREVVRVRALRVVLYAREALRGDPSVEFAADKATPKLTGRPYAEAIEREFFEAGFADAEVLAIFSKAHELNQGGPQRVEEQLKDFLPPAAPAPGSTSPGMPEERKDT